MKQVGGSINELDTEQPETDSTMEVQTFQSPEVMRQRILFLDQKIAKMQERCLHPRAHTPHNYTLRPLVHVHTACCLGIKTVP